MTIRFSNKARRAYKALPASLQKKADKQFLHLRNNYRHPSLKSRKMSGLPYYEARIDYHYRFIFSIEEEMIHIVALGPHDTGLGKK